MPEARDVLLDSTTPRFYIAGRERIELARDVVGVQVEESAEGLKRLQLVLDAIGPQRGARDEQLLYLDGDIVDFGVELKVAMGRASQALTVFGGRISALELTMEQSSTPKVTVFAEDRLMDLRMTRRCKTYQDISDGDLVQEIASRHGLRANADVDGPTYPLIQQWNQSDLAFLRDRARRLAADVWLEDDTLHMTSRDKRQGNRLTLIQGNDLVALEARADLAHQRTGVHVSGYDDTSKDSIDELADESAVAAEASGGRHGPGVLQQAMSGDHASLRVRDVPLRDDAARAWARAEILRRARRFVTVRGRTIGSPAMTVGTLLRLERVGPVFEGDGYYVTRVCHRFDTAMGLRTDFEAERVWIGRSA